MKSSKEFFICMIISLTVNIYSYTAIVDGGFKYMPIIFLACLIFLSGAVLGIGLLKLYDKENNAAIMTVTIIGAMIALTAITGVLTMTAAILKHVKYRAYTEANLYFALSVMSMMVMAFMNMVLKHNKERITEKE